MDSSFRDSINMIKETDMASINGLMETSMKVSLKMTLGMDSVECLGIMVRYM